VQRSISYRIVELELKFELKSRKDARRGCLCLSRAQLRPDVYANPSIFESDSMLESASNA